MPVISGAGAPKAGAWPTKPKAKISLARSRTDL
jgi:hypothetical protein